jgi:predicted ATP-grasp superfamily ATP-dependent carboligase
VFALTSEPDAPGTRSRYFDDVYIVPNGRDEPEQLCQRLLEIAAEHHLDNKPVIFPTRDFDVLFLHDYRDVLAARYLSPHRPGSSVVRVMDKFELNTVAMKLGIPTPRTVNCESAAAIERHVRALRFPLIVKPRFAYQWRRKGVWHEVGAQKAIIVETEEGLLAICRRLENVKDEVLLQEYVPGDDRDIVVFCCYIDGDGKIVGYFTARKLRQNPPLIGTGSVVEAIEVLPVIEPSVQLLRDLSYSGLAEIEYKHDKTSDTYFLIEINPRHWDQHELGSLVGVNLTWLAYCDLIGRQQSPVRPVYATGAKYKWIAETELAYGIARKVRADLRSPSGPPHLATRCLTAFKGAYGEARSLLSGRRIFAMCSLRDPMPGILTCVGLLRDAFRLTTRSPRAKVAAER